MDEKRVRVIRIIEYDFPNMTAKESTESNSFVPFNGIKIAGKTVIRSATITTNYDNELDVSIDNQVIDADGKVVGWATKWNPIGFGEVIVQYTDGSASSELFKELRFKNERLALLYLNRGNYE